MSITGSLQETKVMLEMLQRFANEVGEVIAVECVFVLFFFSAGAKILRLQVIQEKAN